MGGSVPSQVTWMNGVVTQFHKEFPQYAKTQVKVVWVPWGNRTTDWNNALSSGKNIPDITELGNTDTPTEAASGILAPLNGDLSSWSGTKGLVNGMLANDTQNGTTYAVPWFGGVRAVWYRTDQFKKAGITSTPTTWAELSGRRGEAAEGLPRHHRASTRSPTTPTRSPASSGAPAARSPPRTPAASGPVT